MLNCLPEACEGLLNSPLSVTSNPECQHCWKSLFFPLCGSVWSHVTGLCFLCPVFLWMPCCICYANAKKPHVTMETISWAVRQGTAVSPWGDLRMLCGALHCRLAGHVCVFMSLRVDIKVYCMCEKRQKIVCERGREGKHVFSFSSSVIRLWQLIPLHYALMDQTLFLIISVQILVQSATQIARSGLPLFSYAICCDRQLGTLYCLITSAHSYYSKTERPYWPWHILKISL